MTGLETCPTSAGKSSSTSVRHCPPFSHGIVAFNGWPLNALRLDNNYKKVNLPLGKNSAKKTAFSSGKRGLAAKDVFRFPEKLGKHPCVSWGKNRPLKRKTPEMRVSARAMEENETWKNRNLMNKKRIRFIALMGSEIENYPPRPSSQSPVKTEFSPESRNLPHWGA
jgi:hypothetical protein